MAVIVQCNHFRKINKTIFCKFKSCIALTPDDRSADTSHRLYFDCDWILFIFISSCLVCSLTLWNFVLLIFELLMSEFTRREFLNDLKFWRIIEWIDVYLMVFRWKCHWSHEKKKQQQFNDLIWVAQWKPRNAIVHNSNCRVLHTEWFDDMRHNFYLSTQYDKKKTGCGDSGSSSVNVVDSLNLYCLLFCRDIAHLSWHDCELPCIKYYANLFFCFVSKDSV